MLFGSRNNNFEEKELKKIDKAEEKLRKRAIENNSTLMDKLEKKIPPNVYSSLEKAFCKAFEIVFEKGTQIIEKTYNRFSNRENHEAKNYVEIIESGQREFRRIYEEATRSKFGNMALTAVEGAGLGALGIGLPDIVLFVGMIFKGIYETADKYGIDYKNIHEQMLILKMIEASVSKGDDWETKNEEVDKVLRDPEEIETNHEEIKKQIGKTASSFAADMLALKFIQGIPIIGIVGGFGNTTYYNRVLTYAQLKYKKRYLMDYAERNRH